MSSRAQPLPSSMQALLADGPQRFAVQEVPRPRPNPGDVVVKILHSTICGSDVKLLTGDMADIAFPLIPGHEWCGEVVAAPSDHQHLVGQRVVADILQGCEHCGYCRRGQANLCPDLVEPGLSANGSFAEYLSLPVGSVLPLPPAIGAPLGCLVEPLAVVLYALDRVPVEVGDEVLILGGGGIGQLLALMARQRGARRVLLADPHPERRAMALSLGADDALPADAAELAAHFHPATQPLPDVVFDVAGRGVALGTALELARPGGRVGLLGYAGAESVTLPASIFMRKLLDVRGVLSPTGTWQRSIDTLAEGLIEPAPLLTHERPLAEFDDAFGLIAERRDGALRVVVRSGAEP